MTSNMLRIIWCFSLLIVLKSSALQCESYPSTSTEATTHIVSYVHQRKVQKQQQQHPKDLKHNEIEESDFEKFRSNLSSNAHPEMRGALQQLFSRFVKNIETNSEQFENDVSQGADYQQNLQENEISHNHLSDDLMADQMNTLENGFGDNEQHESPKNETMWQRSKQSIPVLESVRHLVNSVRDGRLNHTEHVQRHRTLLSEMHPTMPEQNTSMAIETEEEREMINGSTDLQFLEVLGSIGSKVWGFFSTIRQVFAASTGSASAALSASSSSSSS